MTQYLILPGLGNSGPAHWQTYFEQSAPNFKRVEQTEWDAPNCANWIDTIDRAVLAYEPSNVVLIGHSLACCTIAHWANSYQRKIKGALLVAPSDIENPVYTFPSTGFAPIPLQTIPFKTLVVASDNDPWVSLERAQLFAKAWGSSLINIGAAGHINADSGYGKWEQGLQYLNNFE
ncbi:MAG: hypothetical protein RLY89_1712 [Bacteroidota bacterium]|jgi:predicted alpha/beta hydrolase family esterase